MRRIYMSFFLRKGWVCGFLEEDLKTAIGRGCILASPEKVKDLISRTPTRMDLAAHQAVDHGIENGRGGLFLSVTDEQYQKLKKKA